MGELVQSRVLRKELTPQIALLAEKGKKSVSLHCPKRMESKLRGMKNANLHYWQQSFPQLMVEVFADSLSEKIWVE